MKSEDKFSYKIIEHIAVLSSTNYTTFELNKVEYNGNMVRYDIRRWRRKDGKEEMLKGITLTDEEASNLMKALNSKSKL